MTYIANRSTSFWDEGLMRRGSGKPSAYELTRYLRAVGNFVRIVTLAYLRIGW